MSRKPHRRAPARGQAKSSIGSRTARTLRIEPLEDRRLLAVITVDTVEDVVDFNDGRTSLREAIFAANTVAGPDEIRFDFGHDGSATIKLSQGALVITDSMTIAGSGPDLLTIDGQLQSRIFEISGTGDMMIAKMRITRGSAESHGGAIRAATTGTLLLEQVLVTGSIAKGPGAQGGGVYAIGPASLRQSEIAFNRSAVGAGIATHGPLEIVASTIAENTAIDNQFAAGGGIYAATDLTLASSTVSNNGVNVLGADGRAQGGGVWSGGELIIKHSTIVANTASSLREGAVASGGGLYAVSGTDLNALLSHTIIAGNHSTESAADLFLGEQPATATYSLIGDNDGSPFAEAHVGRPDARGNLIGGTTYGFIDPMLGGLDRNGGPTRTHALLNGSPAISAGDPSLEPGATASQFDQRGPGYARRRGTRIDIGAVENDLNPWIVDSLDDAVDGNFGPGQFTLREALEQANANPTADAIEFSPALFAAGPATILLTNGELSSDGVLEIRGPGAALLTIDATGNDPTPGVLRGDGSRVLTLTGSHGEIPRDIPAFVSGVTLTGGDQSNGGAVRSNIELTLRDVHAHGNSTINHGASVYATWLAVQASRFTGNLSWSDGSDIYTTQSLVFENSIVANHQSLIGQGPAVYHEFLRGRAQDVVLFRSVIENNSGWGVVLRSVSDIWISDCMIQNNQGVGIGISKAAHSAAFSILNTSINGNRNMGLFVTAPGLVDNSTISGNSTFGPAGGVHARSPLTVRHSTIVNNHGDRDGDYVGASGGIIAEDGLTLDHTILAGNVTGEGAIPSDITADEVDVRFSLIGHNAGSPLAESSPGAPDHNGNLIGGPLHGPIDPLLAPLADNGGPTPTHALLPGSPAIDAGDPALVAGVGDTPRYDQRGEPFSRVAGGRIDVGAVEETLISPFLVDSLDDKDDGDFAPGKLSLREAVRLSNKVSGVQTIEFHPALWADGPATIPLALGELTISDAVEIRGPGADLLTIDASGSDPTPNEHRGDGSRIFNISIAPSERNEPADAAVTIAGLTLTGGDVYEPGGAIRSTSDLLIEGSRVVDNQTTSWGGGAWVQGASLTIVGSEISKNSSTRGGGAAVIDGNLSIAASTFTENTAASSAGRGGGILVQGHSDLISIHDSTIVRNSSSHSGGGLHIETTAVGAAVVVERTAVTENVVGNGAPVGSRPASGGVFLAFNAAGATLLFNQVSVTQNAISGFGGGLALRLGLRSTATIVDSDLSDNTAGLTTPVGSGGGLSVSMSISDSLRIERTTINGNKAGLHGGGLHFTTEYPNSGFTGVVAIVDSTIAGNSALASGGGVAALWMQLPGSDGPPRPRLEPASEIRFASDGKPQNQEMAPAAFADDAPVHLQIVRSTIHDNSAGWEGGGLFLHGSERTAIRDSTISLNRASGSGGGLARIARVAIVAPDFPETLAYNVTISGNSAAGNGGGAYVELRSGGAVALTRVTVTNNLSDANRDATGAGGGVFLARGQLTLDHALVADNRDRTALAPDLAGLLGATFSPRYSLIGTSAGGGLSPAPVGSPDADGNLIGGATPGTNINPRLNSLADNGGLTPTHALLPGSPAIDAGDPAFIPGLNGAPEFDQRGAPYARVAGGRIDIGAYEVQPPSGALSADFNLDGRVDGSDFLAWQQNLGRTAGATLRHGDATADGDVDVHDLAVWRATFGRDESARPAKPSAFSQSEAGQGAAEMLDRALAALATSVIDGREQSPRSFGARRANSRPAEDMDVVAKRALAGASDHAARVIDVTSTVQWRDAALVALADDRVDEGTGASCRPSPGPSLRGRGIGDELP